MIHIEIYKTFLFPAIGNMVRNAMEHTLVE